MGTERLPSLVIADDSTRTWRFEIDQDLRMAMGIPGTSKTVAVHRNLNVVRPATGDNAEIAFYTGGELGTTFEYSLKLETSGTLNFYAYGGGGFPVALSINSSGVATLNGSKILTGSLTWDPPNIAAGAEATNTVTVTGAATANSAVLVTPDQAVTAGLIISGYVSAANTVTVRIFNATAGGINYGSTIFRVVVFQY